MDGDQTERALARIDAALKRIEAAGRRAPAAHLGDPGLEQRHAELRATVSDTLRELDELIAESVS